MKWDCSCWDKQQYQAFITYLHSCADEEYRKFHSRLVPTVDQLIGIRVPVMRSIAKEIAKGDLDGFLSCCPCRLYEETMVAGLAIGFDRDWDKTLRRLEGFVPHIDNWGVCDSVCAGLKLFDRRRQEGMDWLKPYRESGREFDQRFFLVMLLFHYLTPEWISQVLERSCAIRPAGYYAMMAQAWLMAECCIRFPEQADPWLFQLSEQARKKAVQKIRESRKVSPERKQAYLDYISLKQRKREES